MSEILLREGAARDRRAITDLWVTAWSAAMPAIDFEARRAWLEARLVQLDAAGSRTIVASDAQEALVGFVTVDPANGYMDQLAVSPPAQRRGVAARLLAEARRISPDCLALRVNQDNAPAVRFYERQGFVPTGQGANPGSGLPIWHMEWHPDGHGSSGHGAEMSARAFGSHQSRGAARVVPSTAAPAGGPEAEHFKA